MMGGGLLNLFDGLFGNDIYRKDDRKNDTRLIIERDFADNIGLSTGNGKLNATVSIIQFVEKHSVNPIPAILRLGLGTSTFLGYYNQGTPNATTGKKDWAFPAVMGVMSFGISSTMIGVPRWRKQSASIALEVVLKDNVGNVLGRYIAVGDADTRTGWYPWNYSKYAAKHYANIKAVTSAMNVIKKQIDQDYDKIVTRTK